MRDGKTYRREDQPKSGDNRASLVLEILAAWMQRHATLLLLAVLCASCLHLVWSNPAKWIWFDEMFTWNLTQQSDWHLYWRGLPADANPPLGSMLAWISTHIFGDSLLTLRLPSLLGFLGATVLLYRIVSIRLGKLAGLMAAVLFQVNGQVNIYAIEARPYALVLLFTTAAFASWQMATDEARPRPWARWAIAASLAGAILSHHYGIFSAGLPLVFGEVARSIQRRRVDWKLAGTACTGLLAFPVTLPLIRGTQRTWLQYSLYPHIFPHSLRGSSYLALLSSQQRRVVGMVLVLAVCGWVWSRLRPAQAWGPNLRRSWPRYELAGLAGSVVTLGIVYALCLKSSGYFGGFRYGIGTYFGMVALIATLFSTLDRRMQAVVLVFAAWPVARSIPVHRLPAAVQPPESACIRALPTEPVVMAQALNYPSAWHYADTATRARLFYLTDDAYAKRQSYNTPEVAMAAQKFIMPLSLVDYHEFLQTHPSFFAVASGMPTQDYPIDHLKQDGYTLTPLEVPACVKPLQAYRANRR